MRILFRRIDLKLARPFSTSTGTTAQRQSVLVAVEHAGRVGFGEAAPVRMYGQSVESVVAALHRAAAALGDDPLAFEPIADRLLAALPGEAAAAAAVDAAVHDLAGQLVGLPTWRRLGVGTRAADMPPTSFSIGIDAIELIEEKVREALAMPEAPKSGWPFLKVKLGSDQDERIVEAVRRAAPAAALRVDANGGWDLPTAQRMCCWLAEQNVELVEQPFARGRLELFRKLKPCCPLPVYADEDCHEAGDVLRLGGCVDGVNLKLSKAGGISAGLRLIHAARAAGLKVMIGCQLESSVGIAAAAQLAPLCDAVDLDGHLLLAEDLAGGLTCRDARLVLSEQPGQGLTLRDDLRDLTRWQAV